MDYNDQFPFENAEVYKKAIAFNQECREICKMILASDADQLRRAALSICNNIAEGYGRWHIRDKQHFYTIARGSAYECLPILTLLVKENKIIPKQMENLRHELAEITKMLSSLIKGVGNRE